jgi:hypothetical protein
MFAGTIRGAIVPRNTRAANVESNPNPRVRVKSRFCTVRRRLIGVRMF